MFYALYLSSDQPFHLVRCPRKDLCQEAAVTSPFQDIKVSEEEEEFF